MPFVMGALGWRLAEIFRHFTRIVPFILGLSVVGYATESHADCTTPDGSLAVTCSGSIPGGISFTDGSVETLTIENLTATIATDNPVVLSDTGADDTGSGAENGQSLTINADFASGFSLSATQTAVTLSSKGGSGKDGSNSNTSSDTARGGAGTDGGNGGTLHLTISGSDGVASTGTGLFVESLGGGGGLGGYADSTFGPTDAGVGGVGGHAGQISISLGDGQALELQNASGIGIYAGSIGGNGNDGGYAVSGTGSAHGGAGGAGGNGGAVTISATSATSTIGMTGNYAHGVFAQSFAGNGGNGGDAEGGPGATIKGGDGGRGGTGGKVSVDLDANVSISGDKAQGIWARSYGGNGGNGGSGSSPIDGGSGGADLGPGPGGEITVDFSGTLTTTGSEANGILAQSVGGFAGDAGDVFNAFISYGADTQSGGDAALVSATLNSGAQITTTGDHSAGVHLISTGGGGGKGSSESNGFETLGGDGSAGGDGGVVEFSLTDTTIKTSGDHASAVELLSTGGGGGSSGTISSVTVVGGNGGTGGDGKEITVTLSGGTLSTQGQYADGLMASTVGGGGGNAKSANALEVIGGKGGSGGDGGVVEIDVSGDALTITTEGDDSDGILFQSVGGGGGKGAASHSFNGDQATRVGGAGGDGGNGRAVSYQDTGNVSIGTIGDRSRALVAQSIGGGGGVGGDATSLEGLSPFSHGLTTGGKGGTGGDPFTVDVTTGAAITTYGNLASGLVAQSIGGGGGMSGSSIDMTVLDVAVSDITQQTGGDGGAGGIGKKVTITSSGDITTFGHQSDGIIVQSIGGGGGATGSVVSASVDSVNLTFGSAASGAGIGATGGDGGDGGIVEATIGGDVFTAGTNSIGILAQSIGGGGGKGGSTTSASGLSLTTYNLAVGQSGGKGGAAETVTLITNGDVTTANDNSTAVVAQSVGGSGGAGGNVLSADSMTLGVNMSLGGVGGDGGNSNTVTLTNSGAIQTSGANSIGLLAQSIGGGGGNGGNVLNASVNILSVDIDIGADGGDGAKGRDVTLTNSGTVMTVGTYGFGALAQSIGGQGGAAGLVADVSADVGVIGGAVQVEIGGDGGDGGSSSTVDLGNTNQITTTGFGAVGLLAQSIGGQGGVGGSVVAGQLTATTDGSMAVSVGVGGDGGTGGSSDEVNLTNSSTVETFSHFADGMQAQSISGNGGAGGSSYAGVVSVTASSKVEVTVTVGGKGGDGGTAGDVTLSNTGKVTTAGGMSNGMYGQSIGGHGGDGGSGAAIFADFGTTAEKSFTGTFTATVGGSGGTGNDAGTVTATNAGTIATTNGLARGIFAQSVGGGGGDGGSSGAQTFGFVSENEEDSSFSLSATIGGSGGAGGDGNTVTTTNTGSISTAGIASYGVFAQSVGGGGGNANSGSPLDLTGWVADAAEINEYLQQAKEIFEDLKDPNEIISSYALSIGGTGGAAGNGGTVIVDNAGGSISTVGLDATGIVAQSVGGGGGWGGDATQGIALDVTLAEGGGDGGDGQDVTVSNSGAVATSGVRSMGIYAQSIGGGGGTAGDVETSFFAKIADLNIGTGVVAEDGADGSGGKITVQSTGNIFTQGMFGHGIFAHSVGGGGGGFGQISLDSQGEESGYAGYAGSAGGKGNGGDILVNVGGEVSVSGDYAIGVIAMSAGGDGSTSSGGDITLDVSGSISSTGMNGRGILAQSDGKSQPGAIMLTVEQGGHISTSNGSDGFDTIALLGGQTLTLNNHGTIENLSTDSSSNVLFTSGSITQVATTPGTTINNYGTITGSASLDGDNSNAYVYNHGTFNLGETINLGISDNSKFFNYGTVSALGIGVIGTTKITSARAYEASALSVIVPDIKISSDEAETEADLIQVSSPNASSMFDLGDSLIAPNAVSGSLPQSGDEGKVLILEMTGAGAVQTGIGLRAKDTATVDYSLEFALIDQGLDLAYKVDYSGAATGAGLGKNPLGFSSFLHTSAGHAQMGLTAGSKERKAFEGLVGHVLNAEDGGALSNIYHRHTLDEAGNGINRGLASTLQFHDLLQSCPRIVAGPDGSFYRQQECNWTRVQGGYRHQDRTGTSPGFNERFLGMAAGWQREIGDSTFLEIAGLYERFHLDGSNYEQNGFSLTTGLALKQEVGAFTASVSSAAGLFNTDYSRAYSTAEGTFGANSDPSGAFLSAEARLSALFEQYGIYAKPSAAIAATWLWQDDFTEGGDGLLNWQVDSLNEIAVTFRPSLEIGTAFSLSEHPAIAFVMAGLTAYLTDPDFSVTSRFSELGSGFPDLTSSYANDRFSGDFAAGLHVGLSDRLNLSTLIEASASEKAYSLGGHGKLDWKF